MSTFLNDLEKVERSVRDLYPEITDEELYALVWNLVDKVPPVPMLELAERKKS